MMIIFLIDFNVIPLVYFKDGRCANMNDILPDKYRVKKGDGVYYIAYAIGRMPYVGEKMQRNFIPKDG